MIQFIARDLRLTISDQFMSFHLKIWSLPEPLSTSIAVLEIVEEQIWPSWYLYLQH